MKKNIFLWVLLWFFSMSLYAADSVIGGWKGSIIVDDLPVVVKLDIDSLIPGEKALVISFARPRLCDASADYGGVIKDIHVFYFSMGSMNTWCEKNLRPAKNKIPIIKLNLTESGQLSYELFIGKKRLEGGGLKRYK